MRERRINGAGTKKGPLTERAWECLVTDRPMSLRGRRDMGSSYQRSLVGIGEYQRKSFTC